VLPTSNFDAMHSANSSELPTGFLTLEQIEFLKGVAVPPPSVAVPAPVVEGRRPVPT